MNQFSISAEKVDNGSATQLGHLVFTNRLYYTMYVLNRSDPWYTLACILNCERDQAHNWMCIAITQPDSYFWS